MSKVLVEVYTGFNNVLGFAEETLHPYYKEEGFDEVKNDYDSLVERIRDEYTEDLVEVRMVDTKGRKKADYPIISKLVDHGYLFPILVINDKPRMAGGISINAAMEIIKNIAHDNQ